MPKPLRSQCDSGSFRRRYSSSETFPVFEVTEVQQEVIEGEEPLLIGGAVRDMQLSPDGRRLAVTFKSAFFVSFIESKAVAKNSGPITVWHFFAVMFRSLLPPLVHLHAVFFSKNSSFVMWTNGK